MGIGEGVISVGERVVIGCRCLAPPCTCLLLPVTQRAPHLPPTALHCRRVITLEPFPCPPTPRPLTLFRRRVITFEPVPHFRAFLEYSLHLNNLQGRVTVLSSVVSHLAGQQLTMVVPSAGIWGTAGIDGLNIDSSIPGESV